MSPSNPMPSPIKVSFADESWEKVKEYIGESAALKEFQPVISRKDCNQSLTLSDTLKFARWKTSHGNGGASLHQLLRNADIILPTPEITPRSKEVEARIEKLKIQQEKYEYNKMVENISTAKPSQSSYKRVPVVSGLNFALTVIACVFASTFVLSNLIPDFLLRCAIGFSVGIILMCIEIFLAVRVIMKEENERSKKRQ